MWFILIVILSSFFLGLTVNYISAYYNRKNQYKRFISKFRDQIKFYKPLKKVGSPEQNYMVFEDNDNLRFICLDINNSSETTIPFNDILSLSVEIDGVTIWRSTLEENLNFDILSKKYIGKDHILSFPISSLRLAVESFKMNEEGEYIKRRIEIFNVEREFGGKHNGVYNIKTMLGRKLIVAFKDVVTLIYMMEKAWDFYLNSDDNGDNGNRQTFPYEPLSSYQRNKITTFSNN